MLVLVLFLKGRCYDTIAINLGCASRELTVGGIWLAALLFDITHSDGKIGRVIGMVVKIPVLWSSNPVCT